MGNGFRQWGVKSTLHCRSRNSNLLLPFDIAVRRLALTRRDFERAIGELRSRLGLGRRVMPAMPGASTPEIAALFGAKGRAREHSENRPMPPPNPNQASTSTGSPVWARDLQPDSRSGRATNPVPEAKVPVVDNDSAVSSTEDVSLAARLRKAREQRG